MRSFVLAAMTLALSGTAFAQTTPLIIDRDRTDRNPPSAPTMGAPVSAAPSMVMARMIAPFTLREVRLEGTTLPPNVVAAATQRFIGQQVDAAGLQRITDAVAAAYENSDIALYTIAAPDQTFDDGVLVLRATEYSLEAVDISGDRGDTGLVRAYAEKLIAERPLSKHSLQRYVSLIRDIPGATPNVQLVQGGAPNTNRLTVDLQQKRMQLGFSINNTGSQLLGRYQFQADASFYGLLREGEQTRFTYGTSPDFKRFQYYAFSETQPVGSEGTQVQLNAGLLQTQPKGTGIDGEAAVIQFTASHPLIRSYDENLYVSGGIDGLNSENAVLGQSIANERVRTLRAAASYTKTNPRNAFGLSGTLSFGLDGLGARELIPQIAVPDFFKINGQAGYNRQLWDSWFVRLRANGQYSADRVPTSELFAVGGGDFGRTFPAAAIVGDSGLAGTAELAYRVPSLPAFFQNSEVYVFTEHDRTWYRRRFISEQRFDLSSIGLGTRIALGAKTVLQLEAADVLDAPFFVAHAGDWRFAAGLRANY
jgi:hemolysin activation/secretion protein